MGRWGWVGAFGLVAWPLTAVVASSGVASAATVPTAVCSSGSCSVTFGETGAAVTWAVPAGVASAEVTLYGASGGDNGSGGTGGEGAETTATVALTGVASLGVTVGGAGSPSGGGGYNGGGTAGSRGVGGGGGGGATDLVEGSTPVLIAAGGGGGGTNGTNVGPGGNGGAGDQPGQAGGSFTDDGFTLGGGGGGASGDTGGAGGLGGTVSGPASGCTPSSGAAGGAGTAGQGGSGNDATGGAGGGGGFEGGGSGGDGAVAFGCTVDGQQTGAVAGQGGGGGGSSYTSGPGVSGATTTDPSSLPAGLYGNGEAVISYTDPVSVGAPSYTTAAGTTLTVGAASGLLSANAGTTQEAGLTPSVTSTTTSQGGTVTLDANGDGGFTYTPRAGFVGTDSFSYTVTDPAGDSATATATITVTGTAPAITSAAATTFDVGEAGDFAVTTSGNPAPSLTETGALPGGVTFTDHGNGTASLAGTPGAGTAGVYTLTIHATNPVSTVDQTFTLTATPTAVTVTVTPRTGRGDSTVAGTTRPGANVQLFTEAYGASRYTLAATTTATAGGSYHFSVYHRRSISLYTLVNGTRSSTVTALTADRVYEYVHSFAAHTARLKAWTNPSAKRRKVTFYELTAGPRRILATASTDTGGIAIVTVRLPTTTTTLRVQAVLAAGDGTTGGTSPVHPVTVKG